jgi:hypothetical protein
VALFMVFDELQGKDAGLFHSINGYIFGNVRGLVMRRGEKVRWYLFAAGNERDLHTPHWHGETLSDKLRTIDVIELLPGSMATLDMLADNPGTWMFHCHVNDHMEAGMMATYTIYEPSSRPCLVKFVAGDFWNATENFSLTVENISGKAIQSFALESEHFLSPQYLHRLFEGRRWTWDQTVGPGQQQTLKRKSYPSTMAQSLLGWAFFPEAVTFTDGSVWKPNQRGECFDVFWRDKEHPKLEVLPPLQIEMNSD